MASLAVETALGSFDFLNASNWEEEEEKGKKSGSGRSVLARENPHSSSSVHQVNLPIMSAAFHLTNAQTTLFLEIGAAKIDGGIGFTVICHGRSSQTVSKVNKSPSLAQLSGYF